MESLTLRMDAGVPTRTDVRYVRVDNRVLDPEMSEAFPRAAAAWRQGRVCDGEPLGAVARTGHAERTLRDGLREAAARVEAFLANPPPVGSEAWLCWCEHALFCEPILGDEERESGGRVSSVHDLNEVAVAWRDSESRRWVGVARSYLDAPGEGRLFIARQDGTPGCMDWFVTFSGRRLRQEDMEAIRARRSV